eukprot:10854430-Karenia_brevis.AAC.1
MSTILDRAPDLHGRKPLGVWHDHCFFHMLRQSQHELAQADVTITTVRKQCAQLGKTDEAEKCLQE